MLTQLVNLQQTHTYLVICYRSRMKNQCTSIVQLLCCVRLCDPKDCSMPGFSGLQTSQSLLKLISIESVMPSNHLILCPPLLFLTSIPPTIRVFSNESTLCIRWPKYRFQLWHNSLQRNPRADLLYDGLV